MNELSLGVLSERFGGMSEIGTLPLKANEFQNFKAADILKVNDQLLGFRTMRLIRLHVLRAAYKWITTVILALMKLESWWRSIVLVFYQIYMLLLLQVEIDLSYGSGRKHFRYWSYSWAIVTQLIPITSNTVWMILGGYLFPTEEQLSTILQVLGKVPNTLGLVLKFTDFTLVVDTYKTPPDIPQPYLDADRKIVVPSNKDVQRMVALRNEWFTQEKTHLAAEKIRLVNQIAQFIVWSWALPCTGSLTIFEESGVLWNHECKVQSKLTLHDVLVNEFKFFFNSIAVTKLPSVTILDSITNEPFLIFDGSNIDTDHVVTPETPQSTSTKSCHYKELTVYLQDCRIRKKNIGSEGILNLRLPPFPELTISPESNFLTGGPLTYFDPEYLQSGILFKSSNHFGIRMFLNALFYYNKQNSRIVDGGAHNHFVD